MKPPRGNVDAREMPATPGAYALVITIGDRSKDFPPGHYLYAGSAWGPGGIRARVRRHLKPVKALHWHVDRVTTGGQVIGVVPVPGGRECAIVATLTGFPGVTVPVPGFGSSDCRTCAAHLLRLPEGLEPETTARALRAEAEQSAVALPIPPAPDATITRHPHSRARRFDDVCRQENAQNDDIR